MQTILCQVFESLMESQRTVFLHESPENKGNGFYSRFINHLQGRFEITIPRDRRGQFYPLTLEIIKQDSTRVNQLAHPYIAKVFPIVTSVLFLRICFLPIIVLGSYRNGSKHLSRYDYPGLSSHYHVILIDALYHSVRRDDVAQEATDIVMGLKEDYSREILSLYYLPRESPKAGNKCFAI